MIHWMNTERGYGLIARLLHTVVAIAVILQLIAGNWMVGLPDDQKAWIYDTHKTMGLVILLLVLLRLGWRVINALPQLPQGTPYWQVLSARSLHRFFYVLLIGVAIAGWMMSTSAGYLPHLWPFGSIAFPLFTKEHFCLFGHCLENKQIGDVMHGVHHIGGLVLTLTILVHMSIGLWHGYLRDGILSRIWFDRA